MRGDPGPAAPFKVAVRLAGEIVSWSVIHRAGSAGYLLSPYFWGEGRRVECLSLNRLLRCMLNRVVIVAIMYKY